MEWREYVATLTEADHKRLVLALGVGLQEARKASQVATQGGTVEEARQSVSTALAYLSDALALLQPPAVA